MEKVQQVYKNNKINTVYLRIDFSRDISLAQATFEDIKGLFPYVNKKTIQQFQIKATEGNTEINNNPTELIECYNENKTKTLKIISNSITFEYKIYNNFVEFYSEVEKVIDAFYKEINSYSIVRLGLRYINIFDNFTKKISNYMSATYKNSTMQQVKAITALMRCVETVEFNYTYEKLRLQYGFFNPNYPKVLNNYSFLLDIDVYIDSVTDFNSIDDNIKILNSRASEMFEGFISDEARKLLL